MSNPQSPYWTTGAFAMDERQRKAIIDAIAQTNAALLRKPALMPTDILRQRAMWTTGELTARMAKIEPQ